MKNILTLLIAIFISQTGSANSLYSQLCDFNYNWNKYAARAPKGEAQNFQSDKELIQAHLTNVLAILKDNSVDHLNADQYAKRLELIEVLDGYRIRGLFPQNYYREERIPVFIDEHNTHCAVGYLLKYTGHEMVAKRIAKSNNYAWVKEIQDEALPGWQEFSGFTIEELKLIQGAYDFYMPNAFQAPNKLEIPQKPAVVKAYFENNNNTVSIEGTQQQVWCFGEGKDDVLNGRWEQNYRAGIPWIEGFFKDGARTGQWKEYYKGTDILCRTENWRNDKLNGVRTRFDRQGNIIEKIVFKDGDAVLKTNFKIYDSLTYIRKPLDSNLVRTEIYTTGGGLIATGHERIHNPSNLQWFQNIELTALNSAAITARDASSSYEAQIGAAPGQANYRGMVSYSNTPSLVEYHKEGDWVYYQEFNRNAEQQSSEHALSSVLVRDYRHMSAGILPMLRGFENLEIQWGYDSICVAYNENKIQDFVAIGSQDFTHIRVSYHKEKKVDQIIWPENNWRINPISSRGYYGGSQLDYSFINFPILSPIEEIGLVNRENARIGEWKHYNRRGELFKVENYLIPWKEEEEELIGAR